MGKNFSSKSYLAFKIIIIIKNRGYIAEPALSHDDIFGFNKEPI